MSTTRRRGGRFSPEEREQIVAAYRESGLSQREFAAQKGVSVSSLVLWMRQQGRSQTVSPPLIALPSGFPAGGARAYAIDFRGGHRLEIARGFDPAELERLCHVLHRL